MRSLAKELLKGAVDFHYHGWPEISLDLTCSCEDEENITLARDSGLRGIVVKSHFWPTMDKVFYLRQRIEGIDIFSSITLNGIAGGVCGYAVEAAARQGAKVVWFPTWNARHDMEKPGFLHFVKDNLVSANGLNPRDGIEVCIDGRLSPGACEVLEVAQRYDLAVSTGHISPRESLAIAREAKARGLNRLVFGHPIIPLVDADMESMKEFIRYGGLVEFTFLPTLPYGQKISIARIADTIRELGAENCIMSSDHFYEWSPPECEMMRMFVSCLLEQGIAPEEITTMIVDNPVRLLN